MNQNKKDRRILVVEDQDKYLAAAKVALAGSNFDIARDYDSAIQKVELSDVVITDVFFSQNNSGNSAELQSIALEAIKHGLVKNYADQICAKVRTETGVEPDAKLRKCFETMGYHNLACSDHSDSLKHLSDSVIIYIQAFREEATLRLEVALEEMLINKAACDVLVKLFKPLQDYMEKDASNQPLGYLVAQEAEKCKKNFVLVTSLRHAESSLKPILRSAKARGWNMLEGGDGSKDDPKYWKKAYESAIEK